MEKTNNRYQSNEDLSTFRLAPMKRMYCALGDFGYNFMYYWLSTYLMIYYMDTIGIPAAAVSVMMLIMRIFDALDDPVIGSLADRTNSRWGRYRPWFMLGSIVMACFIVLIFAASSGWQMTSKLLWMWGIYLLLMTASTCSSMPYGALDGCITPDSEDRTKTSGLRMMFANVSSMVTVIIVIPLIIVFSSDGSVSSARRYLWAVLIAYILGLPTMIVSCCKTKEVLTLPPTQNKIPMNLQMKSLVENKAVLILIIGQFIFGCVLYGRAAMLAYYWQYDAENAAYATTYGLIGLATTTVGTGWFGNFPFKRVRHKGKVCAVLNFITTGAYFFMYFTTAPSIMFWFLIFVSSMSFYAYMGIHFGAIGDVVDLREFISDVRCDGFLSFFASVANKAGGVVMPAIGAAVLATMHYVAGGAQPAQTSNAVNWFIMLIPAILSLVNAIFYLVYPINTEKHKEIMGELVRCRQ